ncbi:hypothetical protein KJ786_02580 [Patescibacteria group bacterium]|nr:hypothetical protein [Patescibacteria group bacterium]
MRIADEKIPTYLHFANANQKSLYTFVICADGTVRAYRKILDSVVEHFLLEVKGSNPVKNFLDAIRNIGGLTEMDIFAIEVSYLNLTYPYPIEIANDISFLLADRMAQQLLGKSL